MAYSINYSLLFLITTIVCSSINLILGVDEVDFEGVGKVCYGNSTTSNGSTGEDYQNNVRLLLSVLVSQSTSLHPPMTYISTSVGRVTERAYGSYLCRADLSLKQCHSCLVNLTDFMSDLKTDNSECIGFGRFLWCMVHYSNSSKFSAYHKGLVFSYNSIGKNVSNYEQYNNTLSNTVQGLVTEAGLGNWAKANFATRVVEVTGSHEKIFVLVQCAADLSPMNCSNCLGELYSYIPDCCNGSQGGLLVHANCLMKYNNQSFFGLASHSFMPSAKEPSGSDSGVYQVGLGEYVAGLRNSNYLNNVDSLLSNLVSESSLGYFNTSVGGDASNRAYGFYLCRGDLSPKKCNNCLNDVRQYVLDRRPLESYSNGIAFNTDLQCYVHYANNTRTFVYRENTTFTGDRFGDDLARNQQYNTTLMSALQELAIEAGYGNWTKANFATEVVDVTGSQEKIYVLVQCTPNISAMNCSNCIRNLYSTFRPVDKGGRVLGYNCLMKFNNESFFSNGYNNFMPSYLLMILVLLLTMFVTLI